MPDAWIRQLGDPVLRQVATPLARLDDVTRAQLRRMARLLEDADGAGLAATQVGYLRRAFVFRLGVDEPVRALVNPRIVARSGETAIFLEGCLSFLDVLVEVERPAAVRVEGLDFDGRACAYDVEGFDASLVQHETDHLDGILTLYRATPDERRRAQVALAVAGLAQAPARANPNAFAAADALLSSSRSSASA